MTDIAGRLRDIRLMDIEDTRTLREAADEIERLRDEIERLRRIPVRSADEHINTVMERHIRQAMQEPSDRPRDDGTAIAVGGEPGASAGKSE